MRKTIKDSALFWKSISLDSVVFPAVDIFVTFDDLISPHYLRIISFILFWIRKKTTIENALKMFFDFDFVS